jgi:hypothetical protein
MTPRSKWAIAPLFHLLIEWFGWALPSRNQRCPLPEFAPLPETLPPTSPELAAMRMLTQAFVRSVGRRRAERYVRELATLIDTEESVRLLMPVRPKEQRAAQAVAQQEAVAWLRQVLPVLMASIPPE